MVDTLSHLAESCQGDARPECPILADLAVVAAPGEAPSVQAAPAARFGKGRGRAGRRAAATP
jgi:MerR family transcriptional regulator, copper efflux regulator